MGLLDNMPQPQQMGGLLGAQGMPPQGMPQQGSPSQGAGIDQNQKMIAMTVGKELVSNPTQKGVENVIKLLNSSGSQEAQKIIEPLMKMADSPEHIKMFGESILQKVQNV